MINPRTEKILDELARFVLGKRRKLEYALACLLSGGHLLIEDVPGVGKTTLAKAIAHVVDAHFNRIQFTSDLLPSDLIGVTVFHQNNGQFEFRPGPLFTNVLLADEINRANPKTQSALLEAMHDAQVSHDGKTMALPNPFFVIATQNSKDNYGTFPLPESQLDRFLMKITLGYADENFEKKVISGNYSVDFTGSVRMTVGEVNALRQEAASTKVSDLVLDYIYQIIQRTREHVNIRIGVSTRGGQALFRAAQSLALVRGRDFVIPDDITELVEPVLGHRVVFRHHRSAEGSASRDLVGDTFNDILNKVERPV